MDETGRFTAKQAALIEELATPPYPTLTAACERTGVPYTTGRRWNKEPHFAAAVIAAVEDSKAEAKAEAERIMFAGAQQAARTLVDKLSSDDEGASLRAALAVLDRVLGKVPDRLANAEGESMDPVFTIKIGERVEDLTD